MNQDAPAEILEAARFHSAGPFHIWCTPEEFADRSGPGSQHARVQYYPKDVVYSRSLLGWITNRAEAWENLTAQLIPGCPKADRNRWHRMHTRNYWAWYYL